MYESKEETRPLLGSPSGHLHRSQYLTHLSLFFAVACIVDQFGVNPIIVLPRAIILCGWTGLPLALFVFSLTIYTAMLLSRCWIIAEHLDGEISLRNRSPYPALAEMAWNRRVGKIVNVFINIGIFGSNIPALLLASQNLQFFDASVTNNNYNFSYCYWLIILGVCLCPLTWLGSPKDSKWISVVSASLVFATALVTWMCMIMDDTKDVIYGEISQFNWRSVGISFGILAFQFGCHPAILTIQTDMHEKTELPLSVLSSFFATGGLSMITTIMATAFYGSGTHANLIQGLPQGLLLYIGIMTVTFQLFLSSVVGGCSLFQDLEDKLGIPVEICWQRCLIRSGIVMLAVTAAEMLPRFDLVMGLLGGLFTGPITFILPPLLYKKFRRLLVLERKSNQDAEPKKYIIRQYYVESQQKKLAEKSELTIFLASRQPKLPKCRNDLFQFLKKHFFTLNVNLNEGDCTFFECITLSCVIGIGLYITVSATYFSVAEAVVRTQNVPPCIISVDIASYIINK